MTKPETFWWIDDATWRPYRRNASCTFLSALSSASHQIGPKILSSFLVSSSHLNLQYLLRRRVSQNGSTSDSARIVVQCLRQRTLQNQYLACIPAAPAVSELDILLSVLSYSQQTVRYEPHRIPEYPGLCHGASIRDIPRFQHHTLYGGHPYLNSDKMTGALWTHGIQSIYS